MSSPVHNLNIQTYSLDDILGLFDLNDYNIGVQDLKQAKKRVLMLHPDKSKLDPKYFLFYKKAFDIVVQFYDNQNRQNIEVNNKAYVPNVEEQDESIKKQIQTNVQELSTKDFNQKFNNLFEDNQMGRKPDVSKNSWFTQEISDFDIPQGKMSKQTMNDHFQKIKSQNNGLIHYNGVQTIDQDSTTSNELYDDESNKYVSCDPFSKLKFDDLRKVHRDQSVLAVSENDFNNMKKFKSIDEFNRERSQYSYEPLEKEQNNRVLQEQERAMKHQMMQKEYQAKLQTDQYADKNKEIMSSFLLLHNK